MRSLEGETALTPDTQQAVFLPRNHNMNRQFHLEFKLPLLISRPLLANHIVPYEVSANHESTLFLPFSPSFGYLRDFQAKAFKYHLLIFNPFHVQPNI